MISFNCIGGEPNPFGDGKWCRRASLFKVDGPCKFKLSTNSLRNKECVQIYQNDNDFISRIGKITLNKRKMCSSCCMKLLIATTAFDYFYVNHNLSPALLLNLLNHPQIVYHFCRRKPLFLFKKLCEILIRYGWNYEFKAPLHFHVIDVRYKLKNVHPQLQIRALFWRLMELFHSRKHLWQLIQLENGESFIDIFIKSQSESDWVNTLKRSIISLIVCKHRSYFENKIKKYPDKKCCYILEKLLKNVSLKQYEIQQFRSKEQIKSSVKNVNKYIYCNNAKCLVKHSQTKWYRCKRCRIAFYCSKRCQKYDWNRYDHKWLCSYFIKDNL
eukprot:361609_1